MPLQTQEMVAEDAGERVGEPQKRFVVGSIVTPDLLR